MQINPISITKNIYLQACNICYLANKLNLTDDYSKNYKKYADGRDDGLLNIEDSEEAFEIWSKENHYGHPYEIMSGGNTTHISLYPIKEGNKYYLSLQGKAWNRSMETLNAFVALKLAGYPVELGDKDVILNRYYELDYVGILPVYVYYSYYNNEFEELFNVKVEDSFNWHSFEESIDVNKMLPFVQLKEE